MLANKLEINKSEELLSLPSNICDLPFIDLCHIAHNGGETRENEDN